MNGTASQRQPEGWEHPASTAPPGDTAVDTSGAAPAAEKRVPSTADNKKAATPPLRAGDAAHDLDTSDRWSVQVAAALIGALIDQPGVDWVETHVGTIGPIQVRRDARYRR